MDGVVGASTACTYGCDATSGVCADFVPANQGGTHVATGDTFTCIGTQGAGLGAITATAGDTVAINTTAGTITVNGNAVTGVQWGAPYTPTGSGTVARVAHVKSVSLTGATVNVTGTAALVLLVDQGVTASAGTGSDGGTLPTVISVASNLATGGPGANSTTAGGAGGNATATGHGGGGGAGHGAAGAAGGGGNNVTTGGGAAGATYSVASSTEILEAGEAGGIGDLTTAGGAGGGAFQISACGTISLGANVLVNASGGGGAGGSKAVSAVMAGNGGGGGGSGGTVILEATTFSVAGSIASNGGGGGGGGATSAGSNGTDGHNWDPTTPVTTAATGGTTPNVVSGAGTGGNGGAGSSAVGAAGTSGGANIGGGGAGGATGKVFLNVPPGATAPTVAAASPSIKTSTECVSSDATCTYP
jgi:hypothetical protein